MEDNGVHDGSGYVVPLVTENDPSVINAIEGEDGDDENETIFFQTNFDLSLASQHFYLGTLPSETHYTYFMEGSVILLPILTDLGIVLFPGQILPLTSVDPAVQEIITKQKVIGIICWHDWQLKVGTTADVVEYLGEGGGIRIKAIGRQRFKLLSDQRHSSGIILGQVIILPEVTLENPLPDFQTPSLNRFRNNKSFLKRMRKRDIAAFPWPQWVVDHYDLQQVVAKVLHQLKYLKIIKPCDKSPSDVRQLSYWVSRILPLEDSFQAKLLGLGSALQRLQYAYTLLKKSININCSYCHNFVGYRRNIFSSSLEGPTGLYCNPGGYVHDIVTLSEITGNFVSEADQPSTEFSWFPGYGWTITTCAICRSHLGWKFTAVDADTLPQHFWGLRKNAITMHR